MRLLLGAALVAVTLMAAKPHTASSSGDFVWSLSINSPARPIDPYVEQQSSPPWPNCTPTICVRNLPQACLWSADDRAEYGAYGSLSGAVTLTECEIADQFQRLHSVKIVADSPSLTVTLRFDPPGTMFTVTPQLVAGRYEYRGCVVGPMYSGGPTVFDSNGGWGVPTTTTLTITNPGHTQRKVSGYFEMGSNSSGYLRYDTCRLSQSATFSLDGALWRTGL